MTPISYPDSVPIHGPASNGDNLRFNNSIETHTKLKKVKIVEITSYSERDDLNSASDRTNLVPTHYLNAY